MSVIVQDITARKREERRLRRDAESDPLTGLFNRRRFQAELDRATRLAERNASHGGALLVLDVDDFKRVNDRDGHQDGDEMLCALAVSLCQTTRETDIVARLGGDEFAVLAPDVTDAGALTLADKLRRHVRAALRPWGTSISVGVAVHGAGSDEPAAVFAAADRALYEAKAAGGNACRLS